ncbi:MAG: hypothetical protein GWP03_05835 [Proteobacteria bacterium]|nr:hypothetical protein [Pseudomonadota bacterium]
METIGDILTKDDLFSHLVSLRMAAIYDIFAQVCLHNFIKEWAKGRIDPETLTTDLPEGTITFKQFMDQLSKAGKQAQVETKRNANRALTRSYFKEVFRITQSFCSKGTQKKIILAEPWYQFARILVNSLSHNFRIEYRPADKKYLPVVYRNETLDISLDRKPVKMRLKVLLSISDDIIAFVRDKLR